MRTKNLHFGKRLSVMVITMIMLIIGSMFANGSAAFAAEADQAEVSAAALAKHQAIVASVSEGTREGFELVDEFTTVETDGVLATTKIYAKQGAMPYSTESGTQTYYAEKVFTLTLAKTKWVKIWVEGTFTWNGKTATVNEKTADGDADEAQHPSSIHITQKTDLIAKGDCGTNFLFNKKYAYVERGCTATNDMSTHDFKLRFTVDCSGKYSTDPSKADVKEQ